tara:strand:+ start:6344 stop:7207 length:864 start_codon:yes stop_codon:yes gene_type:complete
MNLISGEKLQELADLTIIFEDQRHEDLWKVQIQNIICKYIILRPGDEIPKSVFKAKSIFVYTHALPLFFERIFPSLTKPIILLSHNSDHGVDNNFIKYLESDKISKWFCQNRLIEHPKLFSFPIGVANSQWDHGNQILLKSIIEKNFAKEFLVYKNFDISTNSYERNLCHAITQRNGIPMSSKTDISQYWEMLAKSVFVISPPGGGIDCHRIWEALYFKTIPVIQYHSSFSQFKHLPILFVESWEDITIQYLRNKAYTLDVNWDIEELKLEFWKNSLVENYKTESKI